MLAFYFHIVGASLRKTSPTFQLLSLLRIANVTTLNLLKFSFANEFEISLFAPNTESLVNLHRYFLILFFKCKTENCEINFSIHHLSSSIQIISSIHLPTNHSNINLNEKQWPNGKQSIFRKYI